MNLNIKERYRRFRAWQESPFRYAMNEDPTHRCRNCGREYAGNFCPCCGQKATLGGVNWSSVRAGVMDIWGAGTRSMTYTLWQLFWRPGYLIRDYISGKRQVSFPPVKMLIIVALICSLASNLLGDGESKETFIREGWEAVETFFNWTEENQGWGMLVTYSMLLLLPTWALFHHSPRCTAHVLPQGFFIQVYLATQVLVLAFLSNLFWYIGWMIPLYFIITYHQLFGYGLWGTVWRLGLGFVAAGFMMTMILLSVTDIIVRAGSQNPEWLQKSMVVVPLGICYVAVLALGYAIGRRTQKRRLKAHASEAGE